MSSENELQSKLREVSAETKFTEQTVHWVLSGLSPKLRQDQAVEFGEQRTSAFDLCTHLIRGLNEKFPGRVVEVLRDCHIHSSKDIGIIVYGLVAMGLVKTEEGDRPEDFDSIFDLEDFDRFLVDADIRLHRVDFVQLKRRLAWVLYATGGALVLASHLRIVASDVGWIGWW